MNASPLRSTISNRLLKFLAAALMFCGGAAAAHAQVARSFSLLFTTNKQADIAIIGNTLHTSSNGAVRANAAATNLLVNNANWMARVDVDSDTNTFTSSAANYTVPTNGAVMFAKLYWGAGTNAGNNGAQGAPTPGLRGQVLLSFNGGAYVSITNTTLDMEVSGNRYQGSRDITDFVRTNGSGSYQVANVQSSTGSNTLAGWSIVIAHTDPAAPPRNIALYDGYANVQGANIVDIPISGFTTPQFNAVVTRIGVVAYEGDSGLSGGVYTGDQMRLNGVRLPAVFDASTPTNDVFNSTISRLGTRVSAKNPDYTNQLGYDIKVLDATGVLTNTATSATITLTTGGETYYPGAVAFATELYAPQIAIPKTVSDLNGGAVNPGDVLIYNLSVTNSGGDWATNVFLIDPVPPGTVYVSNSFQITAGANAGPKTDAADSDQMDFTNGVLIVRLGMGANGTNGGVLSTNQATAMSFLVRVATNVLHGTRLTNQATLSYSALVTGVAFASASTAAEVQVDAGIFGRVFEDVNYAGGAGRNYVSSAGVGLANARVELYGPLNNFLAATLTDAGGAYVFSNISAAAYSVRVVNSSVVSSRAGGGTPGLLPVQTFRTDASSGAAADLVNLVGGANPGVTDPGNTVFTGAQSVSAVGVTNNLYTGGVDFGFNFNTIVSTNSTGQGSARQFITNVNALVGLDRAVIMIPDGSASPGLNPAYDFTVGGFRTLAPSTPLPAITDAVLFDATTVPGYAGAPLVRLSGANAGVGANGLIFNSSGSTLRGVAIHSFSGSGVVLAGGTNNTIAANVLGADPTGLIALPNGTGLLIATNATNNVIGGTAAGAANFIAFNTGAGIAVTGTTNVGNQIRRNSIFSNGGLGIDLNNNGVTLNDLNDSDTGGNTLFNSPVITNAVISGANLVLSGYARPGSVIELFIAEPDLSGFGEGRTYLATVTEGLSDADATSGTYSGAIHGVNQGTDNTARFSFTIPLPPGVSVGTVLTATATDAAGNTSEFGGNAPVGGLADLVVAKTGPATTTSQSAIAYTINVTNNGPATAVNVVISDTLPAAVTFVSASSGGTLSNNMVTWPVITNLASGARTNYSVTVTAPIGGVITNTTSGEADNVDPTPGNNDGSSTNSRVVTAVTPQADVAVNVSGPATVLAGANYTYTITVTNLGPATATNIIATNLLPAGVTYVSGTGVASVGGGTVTFNAITLSANGTTTFTVTVTAPASGSLTNRASGAATTPDPVVANNNGSAGTAIVLTTVTPQADVAVGKSGPSSVFAGSNFSYTISITNLGPSTASNVIASDALPTNLVFVSASGGGVLDTNNFVNWPALTLLSGARTNYTLTVTAPAGGTFTNFASATSPTGDPNPTNNVGTNTGAQVTTTVTPQADVVVTVSGPTNVLAGGSYTYTVSVTNLGVSGATNVLATNTLPGGVIFVSTSGDGTNTGSTVTWPTIDLPAGTGTNFTITVTAPPSGSLTNRAAGSSITPDPIPSNNNGSASTAVVITTVTPQADVAVAKSGPATVLAGGNLTYTISITNFGPSTASNIVAQDTLPATALFVSASSGGTLGGGNIVTWPATTLLSGATTNFTVTVTAPASGSLINRASATSPTGDPNPTNNVGTNVESVVTTTVTPQADVAVGKSGPATVLAGADFTYTINVTNFGPSTASNIVTVDALPANATFVSASGSGTLGGGNVVTWPATTLLSGATAAFTVTVTAPASGSLFNTASASSPTGDPNPTNNVGTNTGAQVTTTVTPQADVAVGKSGPATVLAGGNLTYTISITNLGPSTASNVIAQDNLPTNAVFVSASSGGTLGASNIVTWPATTQLSGGVTNFTVTVTAPASGSLLNRASANSPTGDPNPTNNVGTNTGAQVTTSVTPQADVVVTVTGPSTVLAGGNYTYTVSITNLGPSVATNVLATNALPAGVGFVSTTGGGSQSGGDVTWPAITLASGAGTNFTITVTAPPSGVLTNTAAGASLTPDPDLSNNNGSASGAIATTTVTPQADVAVAKTGPATVLAGANVTYTINVTNFGPSIASNIIAQDNLPTNATFVSASSGGALDTNNIVTWPATTLLSGGVTNFTVTITAPASGSLLNRASANSPTGDPNPTNNVGTNTGALVTTTVTPQADLVVLVSGPGTVLAGGTYTYTVSITNLGPSVATNALATNALPPGVVFVSTTGGGSQSGGNVTWPSVTLASGAGTNFTITVTAPPSGTLINTASGASLTPDPVLTNNNGTASSAIVTTTVTPQADIAVGKSGPATVLAGANVTYTISVTNLGPSTASNVSASDTLPVNATFVSASFGGVLSNGIVTWPGTNLLSGQRQSYTVTVQAPASGSLFNTASASSPTGDPNPTNNVGTNASAQVTTTVTPQADVAVSKSGPATVLAAQNLTYTITVTNLGPSTASNVIAQDNLPANATFVSASGGGALGTNNLVTWPATTLLSGAATTFTVTVTAPASGALTNRASATSPTGDPNPTNNVGTNTESVVTTTVTPQADVAVGKSGPAGVTAGANFAYTISVTNYGPSTASNVVAVDSLPASVTFVSASGDGLLGGGNVVTWPATTLAANAVTNFTVTVTAPASGIFTNIASASSPTGDPNPTNNVGTNTGAQVVTTIGVLADVAVTVSGPGVVLAGGTYPYTVSITNLGPSVATNVLATNNLPGGVVFVSSTGGGTESGGAVTWPPITLTSGSGTTFTITVTAPPSGVLTNTAAGSSLTPDPDLSNNNGSASGAIVLTTVTPQADVAVGKSGPATVLAGANVTYTISVTNFGPSIASDIIAQDFLPTNATFVSASSGGTLGASNIVTWPATTLAANTVTNFTVTISAPPSGSLLNRAAANSPTGDPNPTNNVGTNTGALVTTTVTPQADLVVLVNGPGTVLAGGTYTYTVSLTNLGPSVATNALATNTLPAGVVFVSTTGGGTLSGDSVTWPSITLASGAGTSFIITVTAPPSGVLINTAAGASLTADPVLANNNGSASGAIVTTTVTPQADVAVSKSGPASVLAGANFNYLITITNLGPSTASNVIASDTLPTNLVFVSASSGGTLGGGNLVTWPATTLLSGAAATFTITVTAPPSGAFTNIASATSPTGDPNPTNNVGTNTGSRVTTTVTPQADVAVGKSGPSTVLAGANFTYTISVTNFGPSTASNVTVLDDLPSTVTFVSASAGASVDVSDVSWTVPALLSGAVTNFTVTVTAPASGSFTNVATASSPTGDPNLNNNSVTNGGGQVTTTVTPQADVAVGKSGPATVLAGANLTYTISVTNFGPSTASNIVTVDALPANATFVSASGSGTLGGGNVVTWPATTLLSGATTTFTVTVTAPASGSLFNTASASSPTGDPNPTNNVGTNGGSQVSTTITPLADIVVTVSGPTNALAGSNITYTISITNFGPSIATNAVVTNTLPGGVIFVSTDGGGTQTNGVVTWPVMPTLVAGEGTSFTVTITVPGSGVLTNSAGGGSLTADPNLANNNASSPGGIATTTITPQADVAVGKTGPASVQAGSNIVYTISITNFGPSTASNVVVVDQLPASVTFVSASSGGSLSEGHQVIWPATTLVSGAATNFNVTVTAPANGAVTNVAFATSPTGDPNPDNNSSTNGGGRVVTTIVSGPSFGLLAAPAIFNPQTGLFEQRVTVTNIGLSTVAAVRLSVTSLSTNATFHNPSGNNDGVPYAQYNAPLNPGQTVLFTLEFLVPNRRPFTNTLAVEAVLPTSAGTNSGAGGINISRAFVDARPPNAPRFVIEFPSVVGRVYTVLYRDDLGSPWKVATPSVTAGSTSTQWYDDGPPKTDGPPLMNGSRYYRVIVAPLDL